ncbi:hypothetical protein [Bradyrhizobium niftali]|uniref:hypothetical protein n=1 Tax=Bradyrhizobium niftali TaxID=2560055 RepID=UPI00384E6558
MQVEKIADDNLCPELGELVRSDILIANEGPHLRAPPDQQLTYGMTDRSRGTRDQDTRVHVSSTDCTGELKAPDYRPISK